MVAAGAAAITPKILRLDEKIVELDSILCQIQDHMPEDLKIYDQIVRVRDHMFRLQQLMHGCEIVDFCSGSERRNDIAE